MNFVETAVNVSYLNIEYQEMTRPVGVFFRPQTDDSNGKAIVTVYEALTEDVIRSLDSSRTQTLTTALGGDVYSQMMFTFNVDLSVNYAYYLSKSGYPIQYTCDELTAVFDDKYGEAWNFYILQNSNMPAYAMDPLLYCLSNYDNLSTSAFWGYYIWFWTGLYGQLDPAVLT